jgi:hypothetical protein
MEAKTHKNIKKLLDELNAKKPSGIAERSAALRSPLMVSSPTIQNTRTKPSKAELWGRGGPL